ncbi:MAG: tRNA 2-selenouridine(34) synthase MnmH [Rhodobacteraceae bacterium]|nr:tRNA 2-selenouridine(34) synthase MnmH [Paracoccaceae bacterium]MCZ8082185.1 tRNA 2-selenouridine(34) synthase MnmH [Paracoccaceae bacterium]
MVVKLDSLADVLALGFDDIIDVRAPAEWAEDHIPGAISLPVLDDAERARVGTIYKQVSPFTARKVGAALVAKNAAAHLEGPLADKPGGWQPLVYCWRGGQRSGSFASILSQIGWRVEVVQGGYKSWRRLVVEALYDQPFAHRLMVLDGNTGTAKTEVLALLAARGVQVVDLEGLANHRGSLFGHMGEQPSQKAFEGRLALALARLDPSRPVVVEAESAKVGECRLPPKLWRAMVTAPRISIEAPRAARAKYLVRAYADLVADVARLDAVVASLAPAHPREVIAEWRAMAAAGAFVDLADGLMARHYDPRYGKHRARMEVPVTEVAVEALDDLESLTDRIAGLIAAY